MQCRNYKKQRALSMGQVSALKMYSMYILSLTPAVPLIVGLAHLSLRVGSKYRPLLISSLINLHWIFSSMCHCTP